VSAAGGFRRRAALLALVGGVVLAAVLLAVTVRPAAAQGSVTREDAVAQLDQVRSSIDETLALLDRGATDQALMQAQDGYLDHFELVEIPLRAVDPELTVEAEGVFSEARTLISAGAPVAEVRAKLVELRGLVAESERRLTDVGVGAPALVFSQAFLIIFREGLEVVLLLAVLLGYLESAKAGVYRRPVLIGVGLAVAASALTLVLVQRLFDRLPIGRELLEAITSLAAVAVLFWVSFWLIQRLDHKRWMEFLKARVWRAVSVGSSASLMALGFTAVYREGFESALFYQALLSFGVGLTPWVLAGFLLGVAALAVVTWLIFRLGRKLPVATFLRVAVIAVMVTSVAFLGNAVHGLQEAFVVERTPFGPRLPIFLAQASGWWPTIQTATAQFVLALVYVVGACYAFVLKPRRDRAHRAAALVAAAAAGTGEAAPGRSGLAAKLPA
jgi:high-affinity iron transporter